MSYQLQLTHQHHWSNVQWITRRNCHEIKSITLKSIDERDAIDCRFSRTLIKSYNGNQLNFNWIRKLFSHDLPPTRWKLQRQPTLLLNKFQLLFLTRVHCKIFQFVDFVAVLCILEKYEWKGDEEVEVPVMFRYNLIRWAVAFVRWIEHYSCFVSRRERKRVGRNSIQTNRDQIQPDYVFTLLGNRQEIALLSSCLWQPIRHFSLFFWRCT